MNRELEKLLRTPERGNYKNLKNLLTEIKKKSYIDFVEGEDFYIEYETGTSTTLSYVWCDVYGDKQVTRLHNQPDDLSVVPFENLVDKQWQQIVEEPIMELKELLIKEIKADLLWS